MKTILLFLFILTFQPAFSQTWERVELDEHVSISLPGEVRKTGSGENLQITAITASGSISIKRSAIPDNLSNNNDTIDYLSSFVAGNIKGMQFKNEVEEVENNSVALTNKVEARNVLLEDQKGNLTQIYFFGINRTVYSVKFVEIEKPSDADRKKIFSSIRINP